MQKSMCSNDVAIASVKGNYDKIHFWYMSKGYDKKIQNYDNIIIKF